MTRTGTVAWTLKTACASETLLAGPSGRVLFSCKDGSLHFLDNGALGWVYPGEGEYLKFLMDREGTTYFVNTQSVDPITKRFLNHPATHIHAMSSTGHMLWTMETTDFFARSIQLDGNGRLYLSGPRGNSGRLVSLGLTNALDSGRNNKPQRNARSAGRISEISLLNAYESRPWLKLYGSGRYPVSPSPPDLLSVFRGAVDRDGNAPALHYFDSSLSYAWLDDQSDALAVWLVDEAQLSRGDRLAVILQNVPQFVVASVAAWKLGAVVMPSNPMYKEFELTRLLRDGAPKAAICHREHYACVRASLAGAGFAKDTQILTVCPRDLQSRQDDRVLPTSLQIPVGSLDFAAAVSSRAGRRPRQLKLDPSEPALLLYTSGTTGVPKGAIISHRALAFNAHTSAACCTIRPAACIFALAPLFHITGFDLHMCVAFCTGGSVVLIYRFEPRVALDALRERAPTFTLGAITAYIALMNTPAATVAHFASLDTLYTGGAPVPPPVVEQFAARFGRRLRSGYGMTELGGASHCAPCDRIPVDPGTGALAVGVPLPGVESEVRDETGNPLPVGEAGELVIRGPLVMDCYLNKAEASAEALRDGWMHTGDIAFMDGDGWFYIVDRKKDMICASGYKVWPREVEDVLYQHPAVREAAVVGIPDEYRGETVLACVALIGDAETNPGELIAFCRDRLAAYKAPRHVEIFAELPKTVSGKIMRVELRRTAALAAGPRRGRQAGT